MGAMSRRKGKRGELEVAELLRGLGVEARRGQQFHGGPGSPDVVSGLEGVHLEVKYVEALQLYPALEQAAHDAPQGTIPVVVHRRSRKPWVAILDFAALVRILQSSSPSISTSVAGGGGGAHTAQPKE